VQGAPGSGVCAPSTYSARKVHVRAEQHISAAADQVAQLVHLLCGQIRLVGDPDGTVLHGVNGLAVLDRLVVDAAVLPHAAVLAAGGGGDMS
jgi:hypothetical protein